MLPKLRLASSARLAKKEGLRCNRGRQYVLYYVLYCVDAGVRHGKLHSLWYQGLDDRVLARRAMEDYPAADESEVLDETEMAFPGS